MKHAFSLLAVLCLLFVQAYSQPKSIEEFTDGMVYHPGYLPYYYDSSTDRVWLEIGLFDTDLLYVSSLPGGLGSNDIGLDRNRLGSTKIIQFKRSGQKVLVVEPNWGYRAEDADEAGKKAVNDAFAISVIWGFEVFAESNGRVLVDATPFLQRDAAGISSTLRRSGQGDYRLETSRSAFYAKNCLNFPLNTEFEALVTFTSSSPGRLVGSVAPDASTITLRLHHSFVQLPDDNYTPRIWDTRSSYGAISWIDYSAPLGEPIEKRFIRRHRLEKKDPDANVSDPVEPIVYYVDPAIPEPIRSAVIEGASWWNQAFEAAGYRNAFQVKVLPEGANPMDLRYNMINWVHRSTRGWSYGASVTDPRTGEIIKGHVSLGSLRIRQDWLIALGLTGEFDEDGNADPSITEMALARIRQLACHEVGHTLGLSHNYAASVNNRASVMDYPHPTIKLTGDEIDLSDAYDVGVGEWDKVSIEYGYQDFPDGTNEKKALFGILNDAFSRGLYFLGDQDSHGTHPLTHAWDNGTDPVEELGHLMEVRKVALKNFSEKKVRYGEPLSTIEDVLVPVYMLHRYQIDASASVIGGLYYNHNVRGGTQALPEMVPEKEQMKALDALLNVLDPENLMIDEELLALIPPRSPGYRQSVELFPGYTGLVFDPLGAAGSIATLVAQNLFDPERAARILMFHSRDKNQPDLAGVIDRILEKTWYKKRAKQNEEEIKRLVDDIILDNMIYLSAGENNAPQVRAVANLKIRELQAWLRTEVEDLSDNGTLAHYLAAVDRIQQYRDHPESITVPVRLTPPAGAPIGSIGY